MPDEELAQLRGRRFLELHAQEVVLDVGLEHVAAQVRGLLGDLRVLPDAERLARREEAVVVRHRGRARLGARLAVPLGVQRRRAGEREGEREAEQRKAYHAVELTFDNPMKRMKNSTALPEFRQNWRAA